MTKTRLCCSCRDAEQRINSKKSLSRFGLSSRYRTSAEPESWKNEVLSAFFATLLDPSVLPERAAPTGPFRLALRLSNLIFAEGRGIRRRRRNTEWPFRQRNCRRRVKRRLRAERRFADSGVLRREPACVGLFLRIQDSRASPSAVPVLPKQRSGSHPRDRRLAPNQVPDRLIRYW